MVELDGLSGLAFFDDLGELDRREVASATRTRDVAAGEIIFSEGDEADGLHVVASGAIKVFRVDPAGSEVELATQTKGEMFGELALLEGGTRSASVRAVEDSRLVVIDRDAFLALVSTRPVVAVRFLATLSRLVRERTERVLRDEAARREIALQAEVDRHRTLSQMVAGVAHELNTPLGTANTAADIIHKRLATPSFDALTAEDRAARRALEDAREASELLLRNIARAHALVITFKQVSVQQSTASVETMDIGRLVEDVVALFRIDARKWGLDVTIEDRRERPTLPWTGHAGHLTQVLLNLLGNVGRYAYPGPGGQAWVTIGTATLRGGPAVAIAVRDEGAGIPEDHQDKVWEPFFTTGRSRGGSGLGLAIVKSLVRDSLSGTIDLQSGTGTGTTFTITLPVVPAGEPVPEEVAIA